MPKSAARLGIGGPVGSGKTALIEGIVPLLMSQGVEVAVVTNDLLTTEDADRLKRKGFLTARAGSRGRNRQLPAHGNS